MNAKQTTKSSTLSDPTIRYNWGYNDGIHARSLNRLPLWAEGKPHIYRPAHPFDARYGAGFWQGWESVQ